jgi:hypothetical protein
MRRPAAPAAIWKTASRNASSICSPIAPRQRRCAPTSCAWGSPRWLTGRSAHYVASPSSTPSSPKRLAAPSASSSSKWASCAHQRATHQGRDDVGMPVPARIRDCRRPTDQPSVLTKPKKPAITFDPANRYITLTPAETRPGCARSSLQCQRVAAAITPQTPRPV